MRGVWRGSVVYGLRDEVYPRLKILICMLPPF